MAANMSFDYHHQGVQPGVGLFASLGLLRECPSNLGHFVIVTFNVVFVSFDVVGKPDNGLQQQLQLTIKLSLLIKGELHPPLEFLVTHSNISCRN
jgi:hypothetical protein